MMAPLGAYVSFAQRRRERIIAALVGIVLGLGIGCVAFLLGAAS